MRAGTEVVNKKYGKNVLYWITANIFVYSYVRKGMIEFMTKTHLLNEEELNSVFGGLDFNKLSASEMAEYNRLQDIYMDAMRKAMKDASLMPAADKAYDDLEAYFNYLDKKYKFLEEHS